jgi:phytoene synthase
MLAQLAAVAGELRSEGVPVPPLEGKLLRPAVAFALVPEAERIAVDAEFWRGALAIQMVHEASLLHDDILDQADLRRGEETLVARRGVGPALVLGDHYLTASYRAAAGVGSPVFLSHFIEAVERTVAGEVAQGRSCGELLDDARYQEIIEGKSGELFGAAAVLASTRATGIDAGQARRLGCGIGALYQMVDDFLDYCPEARTGKAPFQDYHQRKHTFVLREAGINEFGLPDSEVHRRLFTPAAAGSTAMDACLARLDSLQRHLAVRCEQIFGHSEALTAILRGWVEAARSGLTAEVGARSPGSAAGSVESSGFGGAVESAPPEALVAAAARALGPAGDWGAYFGRHSKSFRFASLLFPAPARADVEGVYAFCRFTDDLVDEATVPVPEARARLEAWRSLARAAYEGSPVGVPLLDVVMTRMRESGTPFHYADDLMTGVGMDLAPSEYATLADLEVYTYRVASVVGGWVTELFGRHEPELLARAFALGHAMQLTNILRDVGEDWRAGRLYLPTTVMERFGVTRAQVDAVSRDGVVDGAWIELLEDLMAVADRHYASAFEAIPALPSYYRRPVAVAARVYQGIHDEIRRNQYDNGTRRAFTSLRRKIVLGSGGLWALRRLSGRAFPGMDLTLAH